MENTTTIIYKDYELVPVFNFTNGKSDWQIYKKDAEQGSIVPYKTLEEVKEQIDDE